VKLEQFLVKAKVNAYASEGEGGEKILPDGSKELTYQEDGFQYRDRYFGWDPFVGEEVVWRGERILWAMNYYGLVIDNAVSATEVYSFLQQAMNRVKEERPFRGPNSFREGNYEYYDESQGDTEHFTGLEKILYKGIEVYRLHYHGGRVRDK